MNLKNKLSEQRVNMIEETLDKALKQKRLSSLDYERLLTITDETQIERLLSIARKIRDENSKKVLLTPTLSLKNRKNDSLIKDIKLIEELNIPRVNFFRQYHGDEDVINACKTVKQNSNLKTIVSITGEFLFDSIEELSKIGVDTICCNLSTVNNEVFENTAKTDDTLTQRIKLCQNISKNGIGLSSGIVLGIGEDIPDRLKHLRFLSNYSTLEEIPIISYNTYPFFPTKKEDVYPLQEHLKLIAVTRIMYPKMIITIPTPIFKPKCYEAFLNAGADSITTDNILKYEQFLEIIKIIRDCGLNI